MPTPASLGWAPHAASVPVWAPYVAQLWTSQSGHWIQHARGKLQGSPPCHIQCSLQPVWDLHCTQCPPWTGSSRRCVLPVFPCGQSGQQRCPRLAGASAAGKGSSMWSEQGSPALFTQPMDKSHVIHLACEPNDFDAPAEKKIRSNAAKQKWSEWKINCVFLAHFTDSLQKPPSK